MKKILLFAIILFATKQITAQQVFPIYNTDVKVDTIEVIQLNEAVVIGKRKWANDTSQYRYNQMKLYMKIVLPYALEAANLFNEIDNASTTMTDGQRRKYARSREAELKKKFSKNLKKLNVYQGKLLVKMINRLANTTCYDMIARVHNPVRAGIDQMWARANGINLNEDYKPENNRDFEKIMKGFGY
jgi:Domain of unknown function (DUF4294)